MLLVSGCIRLFLCGIEGKAQAFTVCRCAQDLWEHEGNVHARQIRTDANDFFPAAKSVGVPFCSPYPGLAGNSKATLYDRISSRLSCMRGRNRKSISSVSCTPLSLL
jgi:hypothetical protein